MANKILKRLARPNLAPPKQNPIEVQAEEARAHTPPKSSVSTSPAGQADVLSLLAAAGRLGDADLKRVEELTAATGNSIPVVLDRLGVLAELEWAEATAQLNRLYVLRSDDFPDPLPEHPSLSMAFYRQRGVVPLSVDGEAPSFAVVDPADPFVLKTLRIVFGVVPQLAVTTSRDVDAALTRHANAAAIVRRDMGAHAQDAEYLVELANDAPTIKLVDRIFATALERGATDIHLEAFDRKARLRYRVDGVLIEPGPLPTDLYPGVVSRLKILAGLDIAERRLPQDGRIRHRSHGRELDLRVATAPAVHGETIAMRILNHESGNRKIADLHMPDGVLDLFNWGLEQRNGLILVTGPTGSGKTTTLHAALTMLNTVGRKIVAVENPVEIQVPGVVQVQSNADIGLDFPRVLRSFLRHDPDVMMVGEIRDKETAEVAVQAALTGHLVLSTLHTNDAASAVTRLEDMGVDRFLIDAVLRLSAAQRLVRVLCNRCKMQSGPDDPGWRWRAKRPNATPCEPMGCPTCGGTGFKGRRAVFEAVSGRDLAQGAEGRDYPRLRDHADELVALGVTSADEAMRVVDLDSGPGS